MLKLRLIQTTATKASEQWASYTLVNPEHISSVSGGADHSVVTLLNGESFVVEEPLGVVLRRFGPGGEAYSCSKCNGITPAWLRSGSSCPQCDGEAAGKRGVPQP